MDGTQIRTISIIPRETPICLYIKSKRIATSGSNYLSSDFHLSLAIPNGPQAKPKSHLIGIAIRRADIALDNNPIHLVRGLAPAAWQGPNIDRQKFAHC
jgi:hypothetical protein